MKRKKLLQAGAYILTFVVGMWGGNLLIRYLNDHSEGQQVAKAMEQQPAPAFELPDLHNTVHRSSEWQGKVVIVNFWATWCPPCVRETPAFIELQEQYSEQGLQFIGIAIDDAKKVEDFMDTYGVNYPMLIGEDNAIEVAKAYGNRFGALPYTVIIDRQGIIQHIQRGELTREIAEPVIHRLL